MAPSLALAEGEIPGKVVIDQQDSISDADKSALYHELASKFPSFSWEPSALESETKIEVATVDPDQVNDVIDYLSSDSRIQHVEPEYVMTAYGLVNLASPNDPLYDKQWNMKTIDAETAWGYTQGAGVTVAVVDTGIDCSLEDLSGTSCSYGLNVFTGGMDSKDDQSHGSHCAGTIAQTTNNGLGVAGVAQNVSLLAVKVLSGSGSGSDQGVADGIRWAADHGAQVISLSLGGPGKSKTMEDAVRHAIDDKHVVVVAAAGNGSGRGPIGYPAAIPGVIAVSATNEENKEAHFTDRGPEVFIGAPGTNIVQQTICGTGRDNGCPNYASYSGTSMACPNVAAQSALLISQGVTNPEAVKSRLKSSATTNSYTKDNPNLFGAGISNVGNSVASEHWHQAWVRLLCCLVASFLVFRGMKEKSSFLRFKLPMIMTGVGLFFIPMLLSFPNLGLVALSRPLVEVLSLYSTKLTGFLILANVALPALLLVVSWHKKSLRMVVAGVSTGIAGYLGSLLWMNTMILPFGFLGIPLVIANIIGCLYLARFCIRHKDAEQEPAVTK